MGIFDELIGHVIDLNFVSHDEMIKAALLWQIEEYQLGNGDFRSYLNGIHTSHIQLGNAFRSQGVFVKGNIPGNAYMFAFMDSEGALTQNGVRIHPDEMVVLTDKDKIDFTTSTETIDFTIVIQKDFFESAFIGHFNEPFSYDKVNQRIQLKKNSKLNLATTARKTLSELMEQSTRFKSDPIFHDKVEDDILQMIFNTIDPNKEREKLLESDVNANKVRQYIDLNYKDSMRMKDLYSNEKLCGRTVRLGFHNLFGFSPRQYLTRYRLGKTHHALLRHNNQSTTVGNIAYDHGFSHIGRFNDYYKTMFGKTPSTTLKESIELP